MDLAELSIIALIVVVCTDALKESFPQIKQNLTRLIALLIGAVLGYLAQVGILPIPDTTVITGLVSGALAVGTHSIASRMGGER